MADEPDTDPREEILAEHKKSLERIEQDYIERIDQEKMRFELLTIEYNRLAGENVDP